VLGTRLTFGMNPKYHSIEIIQHAAKPALWTDSDAWTKRTD